MHTAMMEQAAHDRNLFQSTPGSRMIDLKFPECVEPVLASSLVSEGYEVTD